MRVAATLTLTSLFTTALPVYAAVPAAPTNLTATPVSTTEIALTWSDNATDESEFRVEVKTLLTSFSDIGSTPANTTAAIVFNLDPDTYYIFRVRARNGSGDSDYSNEASAATLAEAASFFTLPPCRLLDTRDPDGPYGGPQLTSGIERTFDAAGQCGIPTTATALSVNITVVSPSGDGYMTLAPGGLPVPGTSTVNFSAGQTRANNAMLRLGSMTGRPFKVLPVVTGNGTVHLLVDVNGYFE